MALDESKETDEVFTIDKFTFIVDTNFMKKAQPIKVDFGGFGFSITSSIDLKSGCSSCGTEKSCCS